MENNIVVLCYHKYIYACVALEGLNDTVLFYLSYRYLASYWILYYSLCLTVDEVIWYGWSILTGET